MAWSKSTRITTMLAIDVVFFVLELGTGLVVGSLALMADAFHMLNDIISLLVGLWAVNASKKRRSDKYSFGWLRAEILGAFFNAVFLIALCLSIVLEAITRFLEPPEISNPKLILIVGCMGLLSNLVGFAVLGGHSHGEEGDDHQHSDKVRDAEEGHNHDEMSGLTYTSSIEARPASDILDDATAARTMHVTSETSRHIKFTPSGETASASHGSESSLPRTATRSSRHRRRGSSIRASRLSNIEDIGIHPASFRQGIIAISRPLSDGEESPGSDDECEDEAVAPTETLPLIGKPCTASATTLTLSDGGRRDTGPGGDSLHKEHNHNKPKKSGKKGSHSHSHGDLGLRAMVLHVLGDALGNVGVIASALIIWLTPWPGRFYADPAVSLFITLIILRSTIPLTLATAKILLQATPDHLDVNNIKEDIQDIRGVVSCHHVHIWELSNSQIIASLHIRVSFPFDEAGGSERYMKLAKEVRECLHAYGIHSATIQPEFCLDKTHDHDHDENAGLRYDGHGQGVAKDCSSCLLECVDDCDGRGCCSDPNGVNGSVADGGHIH